MFQFCPEAATSRDAVLNLGQSLMVGQVGPEMSGLDMGDMGQ